MKIAVIFPVINCLDYTKQAIASMKSQHELAVVIVDNGSTDGTQAWARQQGYEVIENGENKGLTIAWNQGMHWAHAHGCQYAILANNDILLHPATIDALAGAMEANPDWGIGTAVNERGWCLANGGAEAIFKKELPAEPTDAESPDFSFFMVRFSAYEQVGDFDEEFSRRGKAYFEDNDYHYRMKLAGIPARCFTGAPYFHYGSTTQAQQIGGIVPAPKFQENARYYMEKWGGGVGQERYKTPFNQ